MSNFRFNEKERELILDVPSTNVFYNNCDCEQLESFSSLLEDKIYKEHGTNVFTKIVCLEEGIVVTLDEHIQPLALTNLIIKLCSIVESTELSAKIGCCIPRKLTNVCKDVLERMNNN